MNARILELIKNPEILQNQDLDLLNSELNKYPYLQNIRALHLIGTNRFNPDNYQKELSVTAAYTTDKKILYQLINKKTEIVAAETQPETSATEPISKEDESVKSPFDEVPFLPKPTAKPVFVEGSLNRILFEGEEDFLERETETIDIESTLESGKIVTQSIAKDDQYSTKTEIEVEKPEIKEAEDAENFTPETIIKEDSILKQDEIIEDLDKVSFHGVEEFLPSENVEIQENRFQEASDAENFTPETIVKEDNIIKQEETIEETEEVSFHGVEEFAPSEKVEITEKEKFSEVADAETFTPETIIKEDEIVNEEPVIEDLSKISFHGLDEFLPTITINSTIKEEKYKVPKSQLSKQEEEMQLLIAQVEAKVKASKKEKIQEPETVENHDLNFSENQALDVIEVKEETITPEIKQSSPKDKVQTQPVESTPQIKEKIISKIDEVEKAVWKPMNFSGNTPDSLIDKKTEIKSEEKKLSPEIPSEKTPVSEDKKEVEKTEERPVFNASFFTQNVSAIESNKPKLIEEETEVPGKTEEETKDSNIPVFINTWQNWLKIDRKEEIIEQKPVISKEEVKNIVIEKFIEKEPRISKLKEESDFVVKEKGSNISHLMTETLANLYVDQKLYAKAIKGYETLSAKHPQKAEYFKTKIQEVKELRKNP